MQIHHDHPANRDVTHIRSNIDRLFLANQHRHVYEQQDEH